MGKIDVLVQREHLRAGRAIAGLLQADLAAKAEVSQSLISRFESGKTQSISSSEFEKLVLGLSKAGVEVFNDPQKGVAEVRIRTLNHF
ncbi:helix-turn-helix transcriptional regulator [Pararhizobium sp. A13]|uniref:helix-turn-helix domain-containing protein n=1 Tax=Pararhizobium sp. A13 TaxID=3133975 RepID=UPI0032481D65